MQSIFSDETGRLQALRRTNLLDTPSSHSFDRIAKLAARLFNVPSSVISLVDEDRQWFKARVGIELSQTKRCDALCDYTIRGSDVMVVEDARNNPIFSDNPLVRADGGIRFYAGAPLITFDGYAIGTLCVIDSVPRSFSAEEAETLRGLAEMVMTEIDLRHAIGRVDPVSLLPNRPQFKEDFADAVREHAGERWVLALFNLSSEHADFSLQALGISCFEVFVRRILLAARPLLPASTTIYQIGTISFCYLLRQPLAEAQALTETMVQGLRLPIECNGIPLAAPVCAGVYSFTVGDIDAESAVRMAFTAMLSARATERLCEVFDTKKDLAQRRAFHLLVDAAGALRSGDQMTLHFQPRVSVGTGHCIGVEALVRWTHPVLGPIPPDEFVPLIEVTDLIRQLTEWVIDRSLAQATIWRNAGVPLRVSINVSGRNLDEPDFVIRLKAALDRHDIAPELIELEFTESALAKNGDHARLRLEQIRAMGVEIAIDDFGTGYSNLSYLQRLPSRVLKLDQSFIRSLATDRRDQTIVRSTINMAHELGYRVVAEGVETLEIMEMIASLGCDEMQGYLFARPMPAGDITRRMMSAARYTPEFSDESNLRRIAS